MFVEDSILTTGKAVFSTLTLKGGGIMKTTGKTWMLALGFTVALLISNSTAVAFAQGSSNNFGWYHGMASLAEQEIRTNEKKVKMDNKVITASNITATTDYDTGCIHSPEEKELIGK